MTAGHFSIPISKQLVKRELKGQVVNKLVELGVIVLSMPSESIVQHDGTLAEGEPPSAYELVPEAYRQKFRGHKKLQHKVV